MITNLLKNAKNKRKKSGFTLIELIIVIAIIAILVMIALPKFSAVRENANVKSDIATGKEIQTAVIALYDDDKITGGGTVNDSDANGKKVSDYMQNGAPKGKSKNVKNQEFSFNIDKDGNVTVSCNGIEVYPKSDGLTE